MIGKNLVKGTVNKCYFNFITNNNNQGNFIFYHIKTKNFIRGYYIAYK